MWWDVTLIEEEVMEEVKEVGKEEVSTEVNITSIEFYENFLGFTEPGIDIPEVRSATAFFVELAPRMKKEYLNKVRFTMRNKGFDYNLPNGEVVSLVPAKFVYIYSDSEYEAALKICGNWNAWKRALRNKLFFNGTPEGNQITFEGVHTWQEQQELRLESKARKQLIKAADAGNVSAQKAVWEEFRDKNTKGRPTRESILIETQRQAEEDTLIESDFQLLRLATGDTKAS